MKLTKKQFDDLISATPIGRKGPGSAKTLVAARLYLTGQVDAIGEAAERAGCHYNNARTLIRRIEGLAKDRAQGRDMELVTVEIPKGKRRELESAVEKMRADVEG